MIGADGILILDWIFGLSLNAQGFVVFVEKTGKEWQFSYALCMRPVQVCSLSLQGLAFFLI